MKNKILYVTVIMAMAVMAAGICLLDSTGGWYAIAWMLTLIPAPYVALFVYANCR